MEKPQEPGRRFGKKKARPVDENYDLSNEEIVAPELAILKNWLPAASPTDGQPYRETQAQRSAPKKPPGRIYPKAIDSESGDF
ncbi:hypothetical protein [Mycetocola zhujimingii]|uniref:Uncharacterized protein n=1 Tax=Mycetocola zhujimingii TaxID=2079792 RepID=A0A2U1THT7_9MICO|nr:hypothetical protein [Mycetocola zhujimingii]AWB86897.1 hypothetical protein C3E77_09915 [Mycetocola zhujimingii]PWC08447.1 hypothetical protein DF223_03735 [Mycetocola zhujimingii]